MRGESRQGRFSVDHERSSIITGTTKELVRTVGNVMEWWFYDQDNTIVDPIYDVGSGGMGGGRRWKGPVQVPIVSGKLRQGVTVQNDRGLYNTDTLDLIINMDVVYNGNDLKGSNSTVIPELSRIETNPDHYLLDRIVFRNQVFVPRQISLDGLITDKYTLVAVSCLQVNPEELVNDAQFQAYANYQPSTPLPEEL